MRSIPSYSILEWILRSGLVVITIALVGWAIYLDTLTFLAEAVTGPHGSQGIKGPVGLVGAQGLTGLSGPIGPQGWTGPLGVTGPTGYFGPPGTTGRTGNTGNTGPTGYPSPLVNGPAGPKGPTGVVLTGFTGKSAAITGSAGSAGPTGARSSSSLGITYAGITGSPSSSITASFAPTHPILPMQYPVRAQFSFGPTVSNLGGNTPSLLILGMTYRIAATLIATLSTSFVSALTAPLTARVILTALEDTTQPPNNFASETVLIAPNQHTKTYSVAMRLISTYTPTTHVPVIIGFSATFQCSDLASVVRPVGDLLIAPATLTIVPIGNG